ncbi:MAG TPA: ATP-binding cassette domain-containing protein, partial [Actinomycetota bacterium]|nr:ATP-binding cassette domain-containing protein [Actinomycetota bacterium]
MLSVQNLEVVYEDVVLVIKGVSLEVQDGQIAALLGANGAGKTTLLRAISGLLPVHRGKITKGTISFDQGQIDHLPPARIVRNGISQVMEGRRVFAEFSVEENLRVGAHRNTSDIQASFDRVFELFPALSGRRKSVAGYLSGGEQQMLAIGR